MFYAAYSSSDASTKGCAHQFITTGREDLGYPPQVQYACGTCNSTHGFRLIKTFHVTTPIQRRRLSDYCVTLNITDTDVVIDIK